MRRAALFLMTACALVGGRSLKAEPGRVALGVGASLGGVRVLPGDSAWNTPIDHLPADPQSQALIAAIGADAPLHPDFGTTYKGAPLGIPYVVVDAATKRYPVKFEYADESDDVYYPIPPNPPIEGTVNGKGDGDRHLIVIDRDHGRLFELLGLKPDGHGWKAECGAVWSLLGDTQRPRGWTSADAAGLPIFPGLVRYDEAVELGKIEHALRFTARKTARAYIAPATHFASREREGPPMGVRLRLKASVDPGKFPAQVRPVVVALKRYGMLLADNGGALFLSGAPDPRWRDGEIESLKQLHGRDFEVVQMGTIIK
jgi:hypothetical protein